MSAVKQEAARHHRHYYVAVGSRPMKLPTLLTLLKALDVSEPNLSVLIVCNARDTLDEVASALVKAHEACSYLHSDMNSSWRKAVLEAFNEAKEALLTEEEEEGGSAPPKKGMALLVSSDVCLPRPSSGELSRPARVLINYDIPTKKEEHHQRACCLSRSPGGIAINVLAANEVSQIKHLESFTGQTIEEMPLRLSELFESAGAQRS